MGEIMIAKIRSVYGDIKGSLSQIPQTKDSAIISGIIVKGFNDSLDELSTLSNTEFSRYKITKESESELSSEYYFTEIVRAQMGRVISRLEQEYGFSDHLSSSSPNIVILNKNHNEVSVQIDYTINNLIDNADSKEEKEKLIELKEELERPFKNWDKIKPILIWILNFSKDAFLQILPIIIQKKI